MPTSRRREIRSAMAPFGLEQRMATRLHHRPESPKIPAAAYRPHPTGPHPIASIRGLVVHANVATGAADVSVGSNAENTRREQMFSAWQPKRTQAGHASSHETTAFQSKGVGTPNRQRDADGTSKS